MFTLSFGCYEFKPHFWPTVVCIGFVVLFAFLGRWQAQRADYKQGLQDQYSAALQADSLTSVEAVVGLGRDVHGFPLRVQGALLPTPAILLDNRIQNRVAGYHVLSVLMLPEGAQGENSAVLINRGWLAGHLDRSLPVVPTTVDGDVSLQGRVYFPSEKQWLLKADDLEVEGGLLRVQTLDLASIGHALGVELAPFVLRVDVGQVVEADLLQLPRQWQFVVMSAAKSRAYSVQWFAMALVLLILYGIFSSSKKTQRSND